MKPARCLRSKFPIQNSKPEPEPEPEPEPAASTGKYYCTAPNTSPRKVRPGLQLPLWVLSPSLRLQQAPA